MRPTGLVIIRMLLDLVLPGGRDLTIRSVRGCVVESDFAPGIECLLQRTAGLGGPPQYVDVFVTDVPALVARLDYHLQRHAVGHGTGLDARRMPDGAAAELQDDIIAEQIEQLVHLAGMNAARRDGHDLAPMGPVLMEEQAARQS